MTLLPSTRARDSSPGYKVDISRGQRIGRVSSEWFSRPDDERYLSLSDLYDAVRARAETATAHTVETRAIRVVAAPDEPERLSLLLPDREAPVAPTHWSFGQMCSLVGAPSAYPPKKKLQTLGETSRTGRNLSMLSAAYFCAHRAPNPTASEPI